MRQSQQNISLNLSRLAFATIVCLLLHAPVFGQLIVSDSGVGYIDNAIPGNQIRLRFDAAYGADFPNRAEFIYPAWLPTAPTGPPNPERNVDYQDVSAYLEYALIDELSIFTELPVRFLNPDINDNASGFADMNVGFKWAFLQNNCTTATFQFRTYIPSGDGARGLGTEHVSLEPALLLFHRLSDKLALEAEFRDWIPIDGTESFTGNVLRYGVGLNYLAIDSCNYSLSPVVELVGWTVLDGLKSDLSGVQSADNDTIINLKLGVRWQFDKGCSGSGKSLFVGYGRALSGDVWYANILRAEFRMTF